MNFAGQRCGAKHIFIRDKQKLSFFRVSVDLLRRAGRRFPPAARTCTGGRDAGISLDVSLGDNVST